MGNKNIRICRYVDCPHGKQIDITIDDYKVVNNKMYYHVDCLQMKRKNQYKDDKTKADLQYIKNGWVTHIDKTVVYSQLFQCLNDLLSRGISSEYLVFVFDYVVQHKMNLHFPNGFKFFVNNQTIKNAYNKRISSAQIAQKVNEFITSDNSNTPTFTIKQKPRGFNGILGGGK